MPDAQTALAVVIFAATYLLIAGPAIPRLHIDRPGAAVTGAVLMVLAGVLTFDEAWHAINAPTIVLLLGMMILNVFLEESGFFELAAQFVLQRAQSPVQILVGLAFLSGVLSALFLNDTVCLMLTPPLLKLLRRAQLPPLPFLLTLAMSANVGSVMSLTGNPQNMLIGEYSGWSYAAFLLWMLPAGMINLGLMVGIIYCYYAADLRRVERELGQSPAMSAIAVSPDAIAVEPVDERRRLEQRRLLWKSLIVLAGVLVGFMVSSNLPLVAMTGAVVLMLWSGRSAAQTLSQVNWVLLAFFAGLFIVVRGLESTGLVVVLSSAARSMYGQSLLTQVPVFSVLTVVASNVVSNVPFVVLAREIVPALIEPQLMWLVLALASTFAGNLTIPGSVATLIVLEAARGEGNIGYLEFLRVGIPVTLVTTAVGCGLLVLQHSCL